MTADRGAPERAASALGFALVVAMAVLVPLAFVPAGWAEAFHTLTPPLALAKWALIQWLGAGACACGAVCLWRRRPGRGIGVPALLLLAFLAAAGVSGALSVAPGFALRQSLPLLAALAAGLLSPLFLTDARRQRIVLYAVAGTGAVIAFITLASFAGVTVFNEVIYAGDPLKLMAETGERLKDFQGGRRGLALATLGNPEYVGNYLALAFLATGCFLIDGWGGRWRESRSAWFVALGLLAGAGAGMGATGTRGSWAVVAAGLMVRWLASFPLRGRTVAAGLGACVLAGGILGVKAAALAAVVLAVSAALWQWRGGWMAESWRGLGSRVRVALVAAPLAAAVLLTAFSAPGPWNPRGLRLAQGFASALGARDNSVNERFLFWMLAGEMLAERPVLGVGPRCFASRFYPALETSLRRDRTGMMATINRRLGQRVGEFAHSDHFQMLAETGIAGYALFIGAMTALLAALRRAGNERSRAALVLLGGFMAMMLTSFPLHEGARLATFSAVLGLCLSVVSTARATDS